MPSCVTACKQRSRRTSQPRLVLAASAVAVAVAVAEDGSSVICMGSQAPCPRRQRCQHLCAARVPCQGRLHCRVMHAANARSVSTFPVQAACRSSMPAQRPERPNGAHLRTAVRPRSWCRGTGRATRPNRRPGLSGLVRAPPCHPSPSAHATPAQAHALDLRL